MPIRIPPDKPIVTDKRIDLIRIIGTVQDRIIESDGGLKDQVKAAMREKRAEFAQSDIVVAALRAGPPRSTVDPRKAYKLVEGGALTLKQFLDCVSVSSKKLGQYLSRDAIKKISAVGSAPDLALWTEFKEGVELNIDELSAAISDAIPRAFR